MTKRNKTTESKLRGMAKLVSVPSRHTQQAFKRERERERRVREEE